jgi:hypothetical protein
LFEKKSKNAAIIFNFVRGRPAVGPDFPLSVKQKVPCAKKNIDKS